MARRKHQHEEHINHESWAIPYGDLITLLLAFFVVMYSISSVNEGKYRVLSQAISSAFSGTPKVIEPIQVGRDPTTSTARSAIDLPPTPVPPLPAIAPIPAPVPVQRITSDDAQGSGSSAGLKRIAEEVEKAMAPLISRDLVVVRRHDTWLEVELKTDILFPSGVALMAPQAQPVIDQLSEILARFPNQLRIEGYTDNVPIATLAFPSNWELSAARAGSVARSFVQAGVDPYRLAIMGWGEYRPIADNATIDGRNRNRRVLVVVLGNDGAVLPPELGGAKANTVVEAAMPATAETQSVTASAPMPRPVAVAPGPGG